MTPEREWAKSSAWRLAGLAVVLTLSSVAVVQKYFTTAGVAVYIIGVFAAVLWGLRPASHWLTSRVSERQAAWLAAGTLVLLGAGFLIVYPIADAGVVGGGNDRENNLNDATLELLHGRYPYYVVSYQGLPPDILPGTMMLAAPFVLLGNSAYQNIFWLAAFVIVARWLLGDGRQALLLLWSLLGFAPAALVEFATGGELISNAIYVLVFALLLTRSAAEPNTARWKGAACAVLLGTVLASRANFALLLPLVFSALVQTAGWKPAIVHCALAGATFAAIAAPFYLYNPAGFAPAHFQNPFVGLEAVLPHAGLVVPGLTALIALGLGPRRVDRAGFVLLANCALVQMFPIVAGLVLDMLLARRLKLDFGVVGWGLFFLFFGVLAAWPAVAPPRPAAAAASAAL